MTHSVYIYLNLSITVVQTKKYIAVCHQCLAQQVRKETIECVFPGKLKLSGCSIPIRETCHNIINIIALVLSLCISFHFTYSDVEVLKTLFRCDLLYFKGLCT